MNGAFLLQGKTQVFGEKTLTGDIMTQTDSGWPWNKERPNWG